MKRGIVPSRFRQDEAGVGLLVFGGSVAIRHVLVTSVTKPPDQVVSQLAIELNYDCETDAD